MRDDNGEEVRALQGWDCRMLYVAQERSDRSISASVATILA